MLSHPLFHSLVVLFALLPLALGGCSEVRGGCNSCLQEADDCGWCGVFTGQGEGACLRGTESGPNKEDLRPLCPENIWRYGNVSTCADPLRVVEVNDTSPSIKSYLSYIVAGPNAEEAELEAFYIQFSHQPDDDGRIHADTVVGYGFGDLETIQWDVFVVAFDTIIEYDNPDVNTFNCTSTESLETCPDFLNIVQVYNISQFNPVSLSFEEDPNGRQGQMLYTGEQTTTDGIFSVMCHGSNGDFTFENRDFTAYDWKCDVTIRNFTYVAAANSSLAIGAWVAGAQVNDTIANPNDQETGEISFAGVGFFDWDPVADLDGNTISVRKTEIEVINETSEFDQDATVYATFFSFLSVDQAQEVFWDPVYKVDSQLTYDGDAAASTQCAWLAHVQQWLH